MFDFDSLPEKTKDYMIRQLLKGFNDDPAMNAELKGILSDLIGSKKNTLKHHHMRVDAVGEGLTNIAKIPGDKVGHFLTVIDKKGRARYLFFI